MISKMSLYKFKAISSAEDIEIKPITIICGKNSCGKSSIIQSLLLLKQTLDKPSINEAEIALEGDYLHYSHLSDISFKLPQPNTAKIEYRFELMQDDKIIGYYGFVVRQSSTVKKSKMGPYISEIKWKISSGNEENIHLEKEQLKIKKKMLPDVVRSKEDAEKIEYGVLRLFHYLPNELTGYKKNTNELEKINLGISTELMKICQNLYNDIYNIKYLSPLRAIPQRAYLQFSVQENDIAIDGSNAAQYLWLNKDRKIPSGGQNVSLLSGVNECLQLIGLDQEIAVKRTNRILYQLTAKLKGDSTKEVPISDIGFGYSQIIPIIIRGLIAKKNSLTIYEQPEIHLHPSSAGNIADLLIKFAKDNKRSIVETHSADLINKLRLRIVQSPELKNMVNIIFVEQNSNSETSVRQFQFNENGLPPEWPEGFIDESQQIAEAIINARINK